MSSLQHITTLTNNRLAAITDTAASLKAQLFELERLRAQVEKALLSTGKSAQLQRWNGIALSALNMPSATQ
jgi:hypothetical protein